MQIEASSVVVEDSPFDREMILKMLPRLNYDAVVQANKQLSVGAADSKHFELPEKLPAEPSDDLLETLHHVLFNIHLIEIKIRWITVRTTTGGRRSRR